MKSTGRHTIMGNVCNLRINKLDKGDVHMLMFDLVDKSGSIPVVAFDGAYDTFHAILKEGATYTFHSMQPRPNARNGDKLQLKLFPDTRADACTPLVIEKKYKTIEDVLAGSTEPANIQAVASSVSEDVEKTNAVPPQCMRRVVLLDQTGELSCILFGDSATIHMQQGDIVAVNGRVGSKGTTSFLVNSIEKIQNDTLATFWSSQSDAHSSKKVCVETIKKICDVLPANVGTRADITAVVRTATLVPRELPDGALKYTFSIVDPSMSAVELGVFCAKETKFHVPVGAVVRVIGKVSAYNTKSLTSKVVEVVEDATLYKWWKNSSPDDFAEISVDTYATNGSASNDATEAATTTFSSAS